MPGGPTLYVGREREIDLLCRAAQDAAEGRPRVILVSGEAGIGKSRLVVEATRRAPVTSATGSADPLRGRAVPYGPWLDIAATLGAEADGDAAASITDRLEISRAAILQEWFTRLAEAAARHPVAFVLEDLQWADEASIDLLTYVSRHLTTENIVVIGTVRTNSRSDVPSPEFAEVLRLPLAELIQLGPLADDDVDRLLEAESSALRGPVHRARREQLRRDAGGNTFYAVELGSNYPSPSQKLREIVRAKILRLDATALEPVRALAVVGRALPYALLADVLSRAGTSDGTTNHEPDGNALDRALDEAVAQGVLLVTPAGAYDFVHGITRAVAAESISPGACARLHRAAAETLSRRENAGFASSGEVAEHWFEAGDSAPALVGAVTAAREAIGLVAAVQADTHLTRAITLWPRVTDPEELTGLDQGQLLRLAAGAKRWLGRLDESLDLLGGALEIAADDHERAAVLERMGRIRYESGDSDGAMAAYRRAQSLLEESADPALALQVSAAIASLLMLSGHHHQAVEVAQPTVDRARSTGADRQLAYALMTLGTSEVLLGRVDEGMTHLAEAQHAAVESGDVEDQFRAHTSLCIALDNQGRLVESRDAAALAVELSRKYHLEGSFGMSAEANYIEMLWSLGEWSVIDDQDPPAAGTPMASQYESFLIVVFAQLAVARGRFDDADASLARAAELIDRTQAGQFVPLLLARSQAALWRHDPEKAWRDLEEAFELLGDLDEPTLLSWTAATALRAAADARRSGGDPARPPWRSRVERAVAALRRSSGEAEYAPQSAAWLATGDAEAARLRDADSVQRWQECARQWEALSRPYEWAYALWRLAEARHRAHDRVRAAEDVSTALSITRSLGATPLSTELVELATRARLPVATLRSAPTSDGLPWSLTAREVDVLLGLCLGRSNKQIGADLGISTRTVGVHVSRVLHKMGVGTRTEAAVTAERAGVTLAS